MDSIGWNGLAPLYTCIAIAAAASSLAITITQTEVFSALRAWSQKLGHMTGHLFQCFYCMSHWIVGAGVLLYQPRILRSSVLVADLVVSAFFTVTMTAFVSGLMFKAFMAAMAMKLKEKEAREILSRQ